VRDDVDSDAHAVEQLLLRHLRPEPRVGWGLVLGEEQLASALIDISDGLSSDLNHLCEESKVGALLNAASIPIDPLVKDLSGRRALDPLMLALHGGEDFELLFTVSPENVAKLPTRVDGVSSTRIGEIKEASAGVQISEGSRTWKLEPAGWEHFQ
jgi:thiamine-monophosphate kinase